jgi:sugar phosphate isomerase/epimerase
MTVALNTLMWWREGFDEVVGHAQDLGVPNLDLGATWKQGHLRWETEEGMEGSWVLLSDVLPSDMRVVAVTADHPDMSIPQTAALCGAADYTVAVARAAALLGASVLSTSLGNVGEGRTWSEAARCAGMSLARVMEFAPSEVRVAVEIHVNDVCDSLEKAEAIIAEVDHPRLGVAFDTSILYHNRIDIGEAFDRLGDRLFHVHIRGATDETYFAIPGRDQVDFPRFFGCLRTIDYEGALSIELYGVEERYGISTAEAVRETLEFLSRTVGIAP